MSRETGSGRFWWLQAQTGRGRRRALALVLAGRMTTPPPVYIVCTIRGSELWMAPIDPANEDVFVRFKTAMSAYNKFVTSPRDGTGDVVKPLTMSNLLDVITRNSIKPEITAIQCRRMVTVLRSGRTRGAASGAGFYFQERCMRRVVARGRKSSVRATTTGLVPGQRARPHLHAQWPKVRRCPTLQRVIRRSQTRLCCGRR